jgi:L-asparaginase II
MQGNPYLVAGMGRFDTELMRDTDLVVKGGAEGVFACGSHEGWGMALKITDGTSRAIRPTALTMLSRRGVASSENIESELRDLHGDVVGKVLALI